MRIAINGFGRIGRNFLRSLMQDANALQKITIVAINIGPSDSAHVAHVFTYDTLMGTFKGSVELDNNQLIINGHPIKLLAQKDPQALPWKELKIDWVIECSGKFTKKADAQKHIIAGAQRVLISAPSTDADVAIVPGVNGHKYDAQNHRVVSLGSCTTNAFLPMLKVLHQNFEIQQCGMTTVHAYTNTQVLLDLDEKDLRRARAAALNIIPTSTGASEMVDAIMPELSGRVQATSVRVPVAKVSLIDLAVVTTKQMTASTLNSAFEKASTSDLKGILTVTHAPLVSSDFNGDPHSCIIDGQLTTVIGHNMAKLFGWYDNEWGYSCRLVDFLANIAD